MQQYCLVAYELFLEDASDEEEEDQVLVLVLFEEKAVEKLEAAWWVGFVEVTKERVDEVYYLDLHQLDIFEALLEVLVDVETENAASFLIRLSKSLIF